MRTISSTFRRFTFALATTALIACSSQDRAADSATAGEQDVTDMARGVDLLYKSNDHKSNDPVSAEGIFRGVLQRTPTHYGATYQLAMALDRGGRPAEARPLWNSVLKSAEAINDTNTARTARTRLQAPDTASQESMMVLGVDLLRRQNNPTAAADQFRGVLKKNPTHYGATYQLAMSLEKQGKSAEAKPLWQKVLGMATTYKDTSTMNTARQYLAASAR
jgi:cytochrome c-type biogenesis protein CcmH/NrfG